MMYENISINQRIDRIGKLLAKAVFLYTKKLKNEGQKMIKKYNTAVVYIHQDEYSEPIPVKLSALEDVAASNNLTIIRKHIDKNSYCNPLERPAMKKLLRAVQVVNFHRLTKK